MCTSLNVHTFQYAIGNSDIDNHHYFSNGSLSSKTDILAYSKSLLVMLWFKLTW